MIEGRKFSHLLKAHQAQTNLPSVAVTGTYDPDSTAPYFDELLNKWALNILERKWSQPLLEGSQRRGLSNGCWERIPQGDGSREKNLYLSKSVDVWNYLYFFECADLVLDSPLVRYSSAGM